MFPHHTLDLQPKFTISVCQKGKRTPLITMPSHCTSLPRSSTHRLAALTLASPHPPQTLITRYLQTPPSRSDREQYNTLR
ncbi:hypothetical protein E2C01_030115 [Portunus trituberculatus]|uniref:Uncharacterized protein n=1 Tax=Portunus trituberculatus TaxID=210409 RepID=A0A5B7ETT9_PORTR|nr:hypothetical protein [Portunus trituberculatus]